MPNGGRVGIFALLRWFDARCCRVSQYGGTHLHKAAQRGDIATLIGAAAAGCSLKMKSQVTFFLHSLMPVNTGTRRTVEDSVVIILLCFYEREVKRSP